MTIKELLKKLRIRKEVFETDGVYYFVGTENGLYTIEEKLENCSDVKYVRREFFTNGRGRICFELN